ncbi:hypothetical protein HS125_02095 [bacterium]|nr:hypothetical protein [bacterium]
MVEIGNVGNVGGTPPVERPSRPAGRRAEGASSAASGDSLSISNQARFAQELERLLSAAKGGEDIRPGIVDSARNDLASGDLAGESAIRGAAEKIIDFLT